MKKPHFILALVFTMSATACLKTHDEPASVLVSTLAGSETYGSADGIGSSASFHRPRGIAVDRWGYVYVADSGNGLIRKISPQGAVKTIAGSTDGFADGAGTSAKFSLPLDVAVDVAGNVYVADNYNKMIRKISPEGIVTTLAGSGALGSANGPALSASFAWPNGVATDKSGNVYVADTNNSLIRKIDRNGIVTTFAGNGTNGDTDGPAATASFYYPTHLVVDAANNIYVSDGGNNRIRKISAEGIVSTFAGSGARGSSDGSSASATFFGPEGLTIDNSGNLYVVDTGNELIRKITPRGVVTTIAGTGVHGFDNGPGLSATFYDPEDLAIDEFGNLYVADTFNNAIRKIRIR